MLHAAEREAKAIVDEAAKKAQRIEKEARQQIETWWRKQRAQDDQLREQIKKEAYEEGYSSGYDAGIAAAREALKEQFAEVKELMEAAFEAKQAIIGEAEPFLVQLSTDIAEKVIGTEIARHSNVVLQIVRTALEQCRDAASIAIYVRPEHFTLVQDARDELKQLVNGQTEIKVIPDARLTSDGCVIETEKGSIDARTEVQLNQIREVLLEVAKEGDEPGG